ncbi:MAG: macro domain-containing protein [Firmicutes bacterium]|nr:macro domain-containing protein [Bacillota bacterium]
MPFTIIREDITRIHADAIVNTANPEPVAGRGTDQGIYRAAGYKRLLRARRKIGRIAVGEAVATNAFGLPARHIIHTVGPAWRGGTGQEYRELASCYRKSLLLARQLGCRSIAFPLIAAGNYHFPKDKALEIALREIRAFLNEDDAEQEMHVILAVFNREAFALSEELTGPVKAYIDENYISEKRKEEYGGYYSGDTEQAELSRPEMPAPAMSMDAGQWRQEEEAAPEESISLDEEPDFPENITADKTEYLFEADAAPPDWEIRPDSPQKPALAKPADPAGKVPFSPAKTAAPAPSGNWKAAGRKLSDLRSQVGESYQQCLLRHIDENGYTDAEVYKRANIDRRLFSKIRSNAAYRPKKQTALALAMALQLNLDETVDLIGRAGIALSDASLFDIIIEYCIENKIYDLITVNAILFDYDQPLLGQ